MMDRHGARRARLAGFDSRPVASFPGSAGEGATPYTGGTMDKEREREQQSPAWYLLRDYVQYVSHHRGHGWSSEVAAQIGSTALEAAEREVDGVPVHRPYCECGAGRGEWCEERHDTERWILVTQSGRHLVLWLCTDCVNRFVLAHTVGDPMPEIDGVIGEEFYFDTTGQWGDPFRLFPVHLNRFDYAGGIAEALPVDPHPTPRGWERV